MEIRFIVIAVIAIALTVLAVAWVRAIRKSRAVVQRYRNASLEERKRLESRMELDSELETYMRPLARWEIAVAAVIAFGMFGVEH